MYLAVAHSFTCLKCPLPSPPYSPSREVVFSKLTDNGDRTPHAVLAFTNQHSQPITYKVREWVVLTSNTQHTFCVDTAHVPTCSYVLCTHACIHNVMCINTCPLLPAPCSLPHSPPFPTPAPRPLLPTPIPCPCSQIKTTSPSRYRVKPNISKIDPGQSMNVHIHLLQGTPHGEDTEIHSS